MSAGAEAFALRRGPQTRAAVGTVTPPFGLRLSAFVQPKAVQSVPLRMRSIAADLDLTALQPQQLEPPVQASLETHGGDWFAQLPQHELHAEPARPDIDTGTASMPAANPRGMDALASDLPPAAPAPVASQSPVAQPDSRDVTDLHPDSIVANATPAARTPLAWTYTSAEAAPRVVSSLAADLTASDSGDRSDPDSGAPSREVPRAAEPARTPIELPPRHSSACDLPYREFAEPHPDPANSPGVTFPVERTAPTTAPMGLAELRRPETADPRGAMGAADHVVERLTQLQEQAPSRETVRIGTVHVVVRGTTERAPAPAPAPAPMAQPSPMTVAAPRSSHRNLWLSRRRHE